MRYLPGVGELAALKIRTIGPTVAVIGMPTKKVEREVRQLPDGYRYWSLTNTVRDRTLS